MTKEQIAAMATTVIAWFDDPNRKPFQMSHADGIAQSLIVALTEQLNLQAAHVEWSGVAKFGTVPIFDYHAVTGEVFVHYIYVDGHIESFNFD